MSDHNSIEYAAVDEDPEVIVQRLTALAKITKETPLQFLAQLESEIVDSDRRVVQDEVFRRLLKETYREGTLKGAEGWIDDVRAFREPWGFDVEDIRCPVLIWHGGKDNLSPLGHAHWLKRHIPHAELTIEPGLGHFGAMEVLPDVLSWVRRTVAQSALGTVLAPS